LLILFSELGGLVDTLRAGQRKGNAGYVLTRVLSSSSQGFGDVHSAVAMFSDLSNDVHRLTNHTLFPTSQMVLLEYYNGFVYTRSDDCAISGRSSVAVEMWRDNPYSNIKGSCDDDLPREHFSLRGNMVYLCSIDNDSIIKEHRFHLSVFESCVCHGKNHGKLIGEAHDIMPIETAMKYSGEILHLVALRDHICTSNQGRDGMHFKCNPSRGWSLVWHPNIPQSTPPWRQIVLSRRRQCDDSLIVNACRSADGDCISLLSNGAVRGVFPSSRIILKLESRADVSDTF
jgi:hypothetical protein